MPKSQETMALTLVQFQVPCVSALCSAFPQVPGGGGSQVCIRLVAGSLRDLHFEFKFQILSQNEFYELEGLY